MSGMDYIDVRAALADIDEDICVMGAYVGATTPIFATFVKGED